MKGTGDARGTMNKPGGGRNDANCTTVRGGGRREGQALDDNVFSL